MKKIAIYHTGLLLLAALTLTQVSCKKDSASGSGTPVITTVRSYKPSPHDSILAKANPGDYIVLGGNHLNGVIAVYFDGAKATVNTALGSDSYLPVVIPAAIPFANVTDAQLNTIEVVTLGGKVMYKFPITAPSPYITGISNEMPNSGDVIRLTGTGLFAITGVSFPGNVAATTFSGDTTGTFATVQVPAGVVLTGPVSVITKFGTSASALNAVVNDNADVILNFDDKNGFTPWSALPLVVAAVSSPPIAADRGNFLYWNEQGVAAGTYYVGDLATPTDGSKLTYSAAISTAEPVKNLALKFEANIPVGMSSGTVNFDINYGHTYSWNPWLINGSTRVTLVTQGWQTFTIPLTSFPGISTYNDIKGQPLEMFYINDGSGITQNVNIGFDNFRIVKIQ